MRTLRLVLLVVCALGALALPNPAAAQPTCNDDQYSTVEDFPLQVPAPGVLGNDLSSAGSLSAVVVTNPAHGTLGLQSDGSFTYTPAINYNGTDSFSYRATEGVSDACTATVTITVIPVNDAPVAQPGFYTTDFNTPIQVTLIATDVDSEELTFDVFAGPVLGTLSGTAPNLTYTPTAGRTGTDSFSFTVSDGSFTDTQVVTISVIKPEPPVETSYAVCPLYDATKPAKAGSVKPIKLQLCDEHGANLSDPSLNLTVVGLVKVSDTVTDAPAESVGNANPDNGFRYDAALGGYIYNLSTHGLSSGTWQVEFTVNGSDEVYVATFAVK